MYFRWARTDIKNSCMNLNNGDKMTPENKLIFYSHRNAWWEPWMRIDWRHPEYTATCFIIVPIVEIHRLSIVLKNIFIFYSVAETNFHTESHVQCTHIGSWDQINATFYKWVPMCQSMACPSGF